MKSLVIKGFILALILPFSAIAQIDPATIQNIRTEGLEKSQEMEIAFNLTDKSGNRLVNSEKGGILRKCILR
jgi:carboxypeptidase Q